MTVHDDEAEHQTTGHETRSRTCRAGILGVAAWIALVTLLILRGTGVITSDKWVATGGIWLIGGGCLGSPLSPLRRVPYVSMLIGCGFGFCAAFLSGLILVGRMHPNTLVAYSLVSLVAFATRAIDGSGAALRERQQRELIELQRRQIEWFEKCVEQISADQRAKGRAEGRIEGLEIAHGEQLRRIEALEGVKSVPLETVENWYMTVVREMGRLGKPRHHILRAVPDPAPQDAPLDSNALESTQELFLWRGYRAPRGEIGPSACRAMRPTGTGHRAPGS